MPDAAPSNPKTGTASRPETNVSIESVLTAQQKGFWQHLVSSQAFWVTIALIVICAIMSIREPRFASEDNFYNITRNFAFIGIMALGSTVVIVTGGIDLSVGSIMGLAAVASGLTLEGGYPWYAAVASGLAAGAVAGAVNGTLIAYTGLSSFVVTLGMLSAARSVAVVMSGNRMLYNFGHGGPAFKAIGSGAFLGVANPVWVLIAMTLVLSVVMRMTTWGRHLLAIGGNEQAANLTGVPVKRVKLQAYIFSGLCGAVSAILSVGWAGSAINSLGTGYELRAIASTVIGGANLMGGEGGAFGAFIGSALLEVIRNSLLMAGVDSNWQGVFVGSFLVLAVLLERIRGKRRE
ncbi:ABC transporter permease [Labrys monachus]|uniref:Ribose transport system permease protein n=1 Tax=Labrys monachus TaxID=217067 RepID=A0ABU0FH67_9HYPH|nr:ABC transporter permease [Labrys monachus]MDQ0393953.1 ribose transport system permease protein [Labrys monachus]